MTASGCSWGNLVPEPASSLVVVGGCGRVGTRFIRLAKTELPGRPIVSDDRVSPPTERQGVLELRGNAADPSSGLLAMLRSLGTFDLVLLSALITDESDGLQRMEALFEANAIGAVAIARARRANLGKVVFASSVEVYGPPERNAPFREEQPPAPVTAYGVTKLAGELALTALCHELGLSCVTLRFTSIYGSAPPLGNALEGFFERASRGEHLVVFGDGSARRDFLHVDDAARALVAALHFPDSGVFNIAHPQVLTMGGLARLAVETVGAGTVVHATQRGPLADRVMDTTRMTRRLTFEPRVEAAEGLRRLSAAAGPTSVPPGQ